MYNFRECPLYITHACIAAAVLDRSWNWNFNIENKQHHKNEYIANVE